MGGIEKALCGGAGPNFRGLLQPLLRGLGEQPAPSWSLCSLVSRSPPPQKPTPGWKAISEPAASSSQRYLDGEVGNRRLPGPKSASGSFAFKSSVNCMQAARRQLFSRTNWGEVLIPDFRSVAYVENPDGERRVGARENKDLSGGKRGKEVILVHVALLGVHFSVLRSRTGSGRHATGPGSFHRHRSAPGAGSATACLKSGNLRLRFPAAAPGGLPKEKGGVRAARSNKNERWRRELGGAPAFLLF